MNIPTRQDKIDIIHLLEELVKPSPYTVEQIQSPRRGSDIVDWREVIVCELYKHYPNYSFIGRAVNRDPSSIRHLIKKRSKSY